jgi:3-isopropylmalate/(R)-2-methylmalate dehydratase large subunit
MPTLFDKVWDAHVVTTRFAGTRDDGGPALLYVDLHLVHEVTSPQAFEGLRLAGRSVRRPDLTLATVDHNVSTGDRRLPIADEVAARQLSTLVSNAREAGIELHDLDSPDQGIVHVIGPELGLTQPGMTIACGDSHTSTHGAFGAIAFGIGTSHVRDVLASQCLAMDPLKVRRITVNGALRPGVYAKDVILEIIRRLGVKGGAGYAYEYGGEAIDRMTMDERMTICNMSIEGAARAGYVNPDKTTFAYVDGRKFAPKGNAFNRARSWWASLASDANAVYDDVVLLDGNAIEPTVTWGINPGQSVGISEKLPSPDDMPDADKSSVAEALEFMSFRSGMPIAGTKIDVAFIGSCTNSRLSDLREAARIVKGRHVASHVKALAVPGSQSVRRAAEQEGLDKVFVEAGFEWRGAGCSMCLGMNPDQLQGRQICASSSNRNFKGRQGSPTGRTLLMSPAMVAAAAIAGEVVDVRRILQREEVHA